jgi:glutamate synthase domain-containing protein 1
MTTAAEQQQLQQQGLYDPANEHDACGVGFVAHIKGQKSHAIVQQGLKILENLDHRGAVGADKLMGDGAGMLIQLPDALYREEMAAQGVTLPPCRRIRRGHDLHAQRARQPPGLRAGDGARHPPKARCCWAGAMCR